MFLEIVAGQRNGRHVGSVWGTRQARSTLRAGKAPIIPRLECIEPQAGGAFTARFGYRNDNALTVSVPYGRKNLFAADTAQARPRDFKPGDYAFDFTVASSNGAALSWKLTPPGGPSTTVTANASSPVCDPADPTFVCAKSCDAQFAAECADPHASRPQCINDCVSLMAYYNTYTACGAELNAYIACATALPPPAENWDCSLPGVPPGPMPPHCDAELNAFFNCLYY